VRLVAVVSLALALAPAAAAGTTVTNPLTATTPLAQTIPHLSKQEVIARFLADRKVHDWLRLNRGGAA